MKLSSLKFLGTTKSRISFDPTLKVTNNYSLDKSNEFYCVGHVLIPSNLHIRHYLNEVGNPIVQLRKLKKLQENF